MFWGLGLLFLNLIAPPLVHCDEDSNCYYIPKRALIEKNAVPGLIVLQCYGATRGDLDSFQLIADSLNWALATCYGSRNHQNVYLNDAYIYRTVKRFVRRYPVDSTRIVIYGFSGQGSQALATTILHPELFRAVVAVCAPEVAITALDAPTLLIDHFIYLVTREKDWNRQSNYEMLERFQSQGAICNFLLTKGEHSIGTLKEVLTACRWLDKQMKEH
jgi:predicted esterase